MNEVVALVTAREFCSVHVSFRDRCVHIQRVRGFGQFLGFAMTPLYKQIHTLLYI